MSQPDLPTAALSAATTDPAAGMAALTDLLLPDYSDEQRVQHERLARGGVQGAVTHPSVAEREERGKATRAATPRRSLSQWAPAVDQHGQVIDVLVWRHRDIASARRFFTTSLTAHGDPFEVITDRAPALANVIDELIPAAFHNTGQYQNNRCEADHGRLKASVVAADVDLHDAQASRRAAAAR